MTVGSTLLVYTQVSRHVFFFFLLFDSLSTNDLKLVQDDTDGTCLGPSGFSECGDATLWKIRRRPVIFPEKIQKRHKRAKMEVQGKIHS